MTIARTLVKVAVRKSNMALGYCKRTIFSAPFYRGGDGGGRKFSSLSTFLSRHSKYVQKKAHLFAIVQRV